MEIVKRKSRILLSFVIFTCFIGPLFSELHKTNQNDMLGTVDEIHVGAILDMGSMKGEILQSCISTAISDFYSAHTYYRTRVVLHIRDSKGQPLLALSSAIDLLENFEVSAIIGAQTSLEAKFLAELSDKTKVPFISFSAPSTGSSLNKYPYLVQIKQDETLAAISISAIVEAFNWRDVIVIHEDSDDWRDFIPHLVDSLLEKNIHIAYKTSLTASLTDDKIIQELHKIKTLQQTICIVHMSPFLTSHLFMNAKKLGMMSEGRAWIMTVNSMNQLEYSAGSSVLDSMQGVVGLKPYIPETKELHNFTSRWRVKFFTGRTIEIVELSALHIWAYDVAWLLAKAVERVRHPKISLIRQPDGMLSPKDLEDIITYPQGSVLLKEILQHKFKGLSGAFRFVNGKLSSNVFEIVNVIGRGERRVGFWNSNGKITREVHSSNHRRQLLVKNDLEDIIWPGGSATIPKGYVMHTSGKKLRIVVPEKVGFPELVNVVRDFETNTTTITGFCIEVFRAAVEMLQYEVNYEFIPQKNGTYSKLIEHVYLQDYDAAVGDITITANRTLYVDFTLPFTDLGVGIIARKDSKNMWIFLKPLTADLWLSSAAFFILTGFVIWLIERPINNEFQGPISYQIGTIFWFSFSTLVFAHKEKLLSNLSRFVVIVWVFVVLILSSSYTATLTSMITVQQIQLNSKENYVGYQTGSFTRGVISNLDFNNSHLVPFNSPEEYADALSRGSKNGGVSAIIDEIPYIKTFLARYSADYYMIGSKSSTNGFAFVFPKGSPLVPDISTAIAKLREDGKLSELENAWLKSKSMFTSGETSNNVQPLTLDSFRGLFLITGVSSTLAVAIFYSFLLYKNWPVLKNVDLGDIIQRRLKFVREYLSGKVFRRAPGETNVIHPE